MNKKVLLSVFAVSLVAAPTALAADELVNVPHVKDVATTANTNQEVTSLDQLKPSADAKLGQDAKKATDNANGIVGKEVAPGEFHYVGKGKATPAEKAPMAAKKAAGKVLPKTSAAK